MDEMINRLADQVNGLSINIIKEKIRNKIFKELERLRKDDDHFCKELERLENNLLEDLLIGQNSRLKDLFITYKSLRYLESGIENFSSLVNTN